MIKSVDELESYLAFTFENKPSSNSSSATTPIVLDAASILWKFYRAENNQPDPSAVGDEDGVDSAPRSSQSFPVAEPL
jgi:hypothetical protein